MAAALRLASLHAMLVLMVQGSMERAVMQLRAYQKKIEERVVAHFDEARRLGDLNAMAACTAIISQFQRNSTTLADVRSQPNSWSRR